MAKGSAPVNKTDTANGNAEKTSPAASAQQEKDIADGKPKDGSNPGKGSASRNASRTRAGAPLK